MSILTHKQTRNLFGIIDGIRATKGAYWMSNNKAEIIRELYCVYYIDKLGFKYRTAKELEQIASALKIPPMSDELYAELAEIYDAGALDPSLRLRRRIRPGVLIGLGVTATVVAGIIGWSFVRGDIYVQR